VQEELQVASRTADEYRDQCKSLNERVESLTCESDRLSKEIKRLEANTEMKSNDYLKLEVSQMSRWFRQNVNVNVLFQAELREMSQTADEYRHKCEISSGENEALGSQVELLSNEIKRLEANSDMKNVECQKLKVNIRFVSISLA
jgi:uncharacterized protein YdcH (DUF465 family)